MEEEIDLRQYIAVLIKYWYWILGLAFTAALLVFLLNQLAPPSYQAEALVVITQPRYQIQFDPRIETLPPDEQQPFQALPDLAISDKLLTRLLVHTSDPELQNSQYPLSSLRSRLDATVSNDSGLIKLNVTDTQPNSASEIANVWADLFVEHVNTLYNNPQENVTFFESKLSEAEQNLQVAQEALVDFQARNPAKLLQAQLTAQEETMAAYLSSQRTISLIIEDAKNLKDQLTGRSPETAISLADDLSGLFLQLNSLSSNTPLPVQLQVDDLSALSNKTVTEQIAFLDTFIGTLQNKQTDITSSIELLQPEILRLQEELQKTINEENDLTRNLDRAESVYMTLANKVEETRISVEDTNSGYVRVASYATVPERATTSRHINILIAGILGLMVGTFGAFAVEWWRNAESFEIRETGPAEGHSAETVDNPKAELGTDGLLKS